MEIRQYLFAIGSTWPAQTFLVNRIRGQIIVRKGRHDKGSSHNRNKCCGKYKYRQCWIANTERFKESVSNNRRRYRVMGNTDLAGYKRQSIMAMDGLMFSPFATLQLQELLEMPYDLVPAKIVKKYVTVGAK